MKIEFKEVSDTRNFVGCTEVGNTLTYNFVYEDKLKYYYPHASDGGFTRMTLECNFNMTGEMLDLLEKSKIVHVLSKSYEVEIGFSKIIYFPRPGFSYEKLQDIIVDICEKFNL